MEDSANHARTSGPRAGARAAARGRDEAAGPLPSTDRAALLRLAAWFDTADAATAHRLFTATFALFPARWLGVAGEGDPPAVASWWETPTARTAITRLGTVPPTARAEDHARQRVRLRDAAEAEAHQRRLAADELRELLAEPTPAGERTRLEMSPLAFGVLMELLTAALGTGDVTGAAVSAGDLELDLRLHAVSAPETTLLLRTNDGELTLRDLRLRARTFTDVETDFGAPPAEGENEAVSTGAADHDADLADPWLVRHG